MASLGNSFGAIFSFEGKFSHTLANTIFTQNFMFLMERDPSGVKCYYDLLLFRLIQYNSFLGYTEGYRASGSVR